MAIAAAILLSVIWFKDSTEVTVDCDKCDNVTITIDDNKTVEKANR